MFSPYHLVTGPVSVQIDVQLQRPGCKTYRTHSGDTLYYTGGADDDQLELAAEQLLAEDSQIDADPAPDVVVG